MLCFFHETEPTQHHAAWMPFQTMYICLSLSTLQYTEFHLRSCPRPVPRDCSVTPTRWHFRSFREPLHGRRKSICCLERAQVLCQESSHQCCRIPAPAMKNLCVKWRETSHCFHFRSMSVVQSAGALTASSCSRPCQPPRRPRRPPGRAASASVTASPPRRAPRRPGPPP